MQRRQAGHPGGVYGRDREFRVSGGDETCAERSGSMLKLERLRWALMATSHTLTALKKGVLSPLTKHGYASPTSWPQGRNGLQGPDEQVGVEQQPHSGSMMGNRSPP